MSEPQRPVGTAWPAMLAATVLFAASYSLTKLVLVDLPPLTLGLVRFALAGALLLLLGRAGRRPRGRELRRLGAAALLGVTAYFALENLGLQYATATDAALLVASYPALTVALEATTVRRLPSPRTVLGLLVTAIGVVLVVTAAGNGGGGGGGRHRLWGDLLMLGSGAAWAGYTLIGQHLATRRPALQTVAWQDSLGAVFFAPLVITEHGQWHAPHHPLTTTAALAVLVVGCSIAAMACYNHALTGLRPAVAVNALNLVPLWGVAIAVGLLGERLRPGHLVGALVVLVGVRLTHRPETA